MSGQMPRSVLITGACGDIGRALADAFAAAGAGTSAAQLALCDLLSPEAAEPLLEPLRRQGAQMLYRQVDVTDVAGMNQFVEEAAGKWAGIDLCVANAGIVERGALVDLGIEAWRRTIDVNLTGAFITAQAAARAMIRAPAPGGHIVLISSWVQDVPRANIGAYCASKGGLKMLAKCLALELAVHRIRVNLIAPGFVDAGLTGQNLRANPDRRAAMQAEVPLDRLISAAELARTVRNFCAGDASYVTGTTLLVDGGASLAFQRPR